MFDLLSTFIRYALLAAAGHLATKGYFDKSIVDYLASAGTAAFAVVWYYVHKVRKPAGPDPMQEVQ